MITVDRLYKEYHSETTHGALRVLSDISFATAPGMFMPRLMIATSLAARSEGMRSRGMGGISFTLDIRSVAIRFASRSRTGPSPTNTKRPGRPGGPS